MMQLFFNQIHNLSLAFIPSRGYIPGEGSFIFMKNLQHEDMISIWFCSYNCLSSLAYEHGNTLLISSNILETKYHLVIILPHMIIERYS